MVRLPVLVVLLPPRRAFRAPWSLLCQFVLRCRPRVPLALLALRACQMIASSLRSLRASHACVSHARAAAVLLPLLLRPWHGMATCQRSRWIRMRFCRLPRRLRCVVFLVVRYVKRRGRRSTTPNFLREGGGVRVAFVFREPGRGSPCSDWRGPPMDRRAEAIRTPPSGPCIEHVATFVQAVLPSCRDVRHPDEVPPPEAK